MARKLKENWIVSYADGFKPYVGAPTQYMIWSAISGLSSILKNKVFFKYGTFTIYPNQYIILTGDPGIGKGESTHPVYNIIKKLNLTSPGSCNIFADRITAAKIVEKLANGAPTKVNNIGGKISLATDSTATIMATELNTLISSSDWMLSLLCDLWDKGEFQYETKTQGSAQVLSGMCVSLMANCVPEYIRKLNKEVRTAMNGGFTARALFIFAEEPSQRLALPPNIEATIKGSTLISNLSDDLQHISTLSGQIKFDTEAEIEYIKAYNAIRFDDEDSDVVRHFKRRMHIHIIKLAMVFSLAHRDSLIIDKFDLWNAVYCVKDVLKNLDKAFRGVGESDIAEATARVQDFIEKKGVVSYNEILKALHRHISPENLSRIMTVMYDIQFCHTTNVGGKTLIKKTKQSMIPTAKTDVANLFQDSNSTSNGKVMVP